MTRLDFALAVAALVSVAVAVAVGMIFIVELFQHAIGQ